MIDQELLIKLKQLELNKNTIEISFFPCKFLNSNYSKKIIYLIKKSKNFSWSILKCAWGKSWWYPSLYAARLLVLFATLKVYITILYIKPWNKTILDNVETLKQNIEWNKKIHSESWYICSKIKEQKYTFFFIQTPNIVHIKQGWDP